MNKDDFQKDIYKILLNEIRDINKTLISSDKLYLTAQEKIKKLKTEISEGKFYETFAIAIKELVIKEVLQEMKNSGWNGRNPELRKNYKIIKNSPDYTDIKREIYGLNPPINIEYYLKNPKEFIKDRDFIDIINQFLENSPHDIVSINERAFQLFNDEKFFRDSDKERALGEKILKNLGLSYEDLNCFYSYEPFFCRFKDNYGAEEIRNILIIENKDTFWSLKKLLFEDNHDLNIHFLIYGEGNKITASFQFVREYGLRKKDNYFYFGDLDSEGINIFMSLKEKYPEYNIKLFKEAYLYLIYVSGEKKLPEIKKSQKIKEGNIETFCGYFDPDIKEKIKYIIKEGFYIPQEALSFSFLRKTYTKKDPAGDN